MKIHILIRSMVMLLISIPAVLSSCKKDRPNKDGLFVYAPAGVGPANLLTGSSVLLAGNKIFAAVNMGFPALITRSFNADVSVNVRIDTSLISIYNKANNTKYPALPEGAFTLGSKESVSIKAGQTQSADSIQVHASDPSKFKTGSNNYLIPVLFTTATSGVSVSNTRQVMFVEVAVVSLLASIADVSDKNMIDIALQRFGTSTTGTGLINLKANLNAVTPNAVNVTIVDNADLIAKYNKLNNTAYQPFPTGTFKLEKADVNIEANKSQSTDNLQIRLPDLSLFVTGTDYLLAVQINENTMGGIPSDPAKNVVYIHVSVFVNNVDPLNAVVTGTTMNRVGWSVTASGSYSSNLVSRVLDGNNATAWDSDGKLPAWIVLDMKTATAVKGFAIVPSYEYRTDNFITMDVLSSNDGTTWKLQGEYKGTVTLASSSAANPDMKNVKFYTPVTARYFKFNITSTTDGSYAGMSELNGIK